METSALAMPSCRKVSHKATNNVQSEHKSLMKRILDLSCPELRSNLKTFKNIKLYEWGRLWATIDMAGEISVWMVGGAVQIVADTNSELDSLASVHVSSNELAASTRSVDLKKNSDYYCLVVVIVEGDL